MMPPFLTGCQNTPSKGSRYCCDHDKSAMVFRDDTIVDEGSKENNDNTPGSLIVSLLNEHTTRQGVIYEVKYKIDNIIWCKFTVIFILINPCLRMLHHKFRS